jgi:hypothetical protein
MEEESENLSKTHSVLAGEGLSSNTQIANIEGPPNLTQFEIGSEVLIVGNG